jgi:7-carboxy-7-deazaguanine synthase
MRIAEIYKSIQGEGLLTGTESVFVRASGCNLRCGYCDTPFASWNPEGEDLSVEEISGQVLEFACDHVVLTGGEPMLFAELIPLAAELRAAGRHITIETAGTLYLPVDCDLMSISPKLTNSAPGPLVHPKWNARHERARHIPLVIDRLTSEYQYQMKFVVDNLADAEEVELYLRAFPHLDRGKIMLMPQGTDAHQLSEQFGWLERYCAAHGLQYCPRKQIEWFGFARGT